MDLQAAKHTAKSLEEYWRAQGLVIQAIIVSEYQALGPHEGSHRQFTVRTIPPMVNGYPKGAMPSGHWRQNAKHSLQKDRGP